MQPLLSCEEPVQDKSAGHLDTSLIVQLHIGALQANVLGVRLPPGGKQDLVNLRQAVLLAILGFGAQSQLACNRTKSFTPLYCSWSTESACLQ